jgi:hypothetical protein
MNDKTCQIELSSDSIDFRTTQIKSYYEFSEHENSKENRITQQDESIKEEILRTQGPEITSEKENSALSDENISFAANFGRFLGVHISIRQNAVDTIIFIQDSAIESVTSFKESRKKEIDDLLKRGAFQIVSLTDVFPGIRIFNSRFVDKIKHFGTSDAYEKSRLVVQAYNDYGKEMILIESLTIQRMSQRLILALIATLMHTGMNLYLRDVTQTYVQFATKLTREFYARSSDLGIELDDQAILRIMKSLYGISEAENH